MKTSITSLLAFTALALTGAGLASASAHEAQGAQGTQETKSYKAAPLWAGLHVQSLDITDDYQSIDVNMPLPALPYMPRFSYHHHAYETEARFSRAGQSGGARSLQAHLPFGLTLEAGHRIDAFGRREDEFIGLTFRSSQLRHHNKLVAAYKGSPQPGTIYDDRAPDGTLGEANKKTRVWQIAGSVALVAVLAGGGGSSSASLGGSGGSSPQSSRDSGRTGGTNGDWNLVWEDNFTGTSLDTTKWNTVDSYGRNECFGGGNNEAQCYTSNPENIAVNGGNLVLTALPASGPQEQGRTFTSGRVQSKGKGDFKYGRFEARIQFPEADGAFPAFWMLPTDNVYDFWPRSGEIDIVENANGDARISGAIHYKNPGKVSETSHTYQFGANSSVTATDWNIYAVEWHQDEMRWYLNGQPYFSRQRQSWNNGLYPVDPISDHAPFDQDFHLILNLALKDRALGSGVNINPAHYTGGQEMRVDYVKVYACSAGPNFCQHE